jgi:RNA polymerase sigma factor (sigma-70 family)
MTNEKMLADSFDDLHGRWKDVIKSYAFYLTRSRQNAEDISQDVFLKLWMKWSWLCEMDDKALQHYIYVAVKNLVVSKGKRAMVERKYVKYFKAAASETYWHDEMLLADGIKVYRAAVNSLPPKERTIYRLYNIDYNRIRIAALIGSSEHTVKNQIRSASKAVRTSLNKNFDLNIGKDGRHKIWRSSLN